MKRKQPYVVALILFATATAPAYAQLSEPVSIHGFGGWAFGRTDNSNRYGSISSEDGEFNNYDFALNIAAAASDEITIHTQVNWRSNIQGKLGDLDYAFVQYALSSALQVRAGKVKSPFGLYTETYDVGTLRPFYLLPQAMYAGPGFVSKAYVGGGLSGEFRLGDRWGLGYDVFGGRMEFQDWYTESLAGFDPETGAPITAVAKRSVIGNDVLGGKLNVTTPVDGLSVGASYLTFQSDSLVNDRSYDIEEPYEILAGHLQLSRGRSSVRSEVFHLNPGESALFPIDMKGAYFEAAFKVTPSWQVALDLEWHELIPTPGRQVLAQTVEHKAVGLALNYWPTSNVVLKLNYYHVDGNLFAKPELDFTAAMTGTLEKATNVFILGTQFSF